MQKVHHVRYNTNDYFRHITLNIWGAGLLAIIARSASQRVCVPMSEANEHDVFVRFQVVLNFDMRFKIKYQIRPTKPPINANMRFTQADIKYPEKVIEPSLTLRLPPNSKWS